MEVQSLVDWPFQTLLKNSYGVEVPAGLAEGTACQRQSFPVRGSLKNAQDKIQVNEQKPHMKYLRRNELVRNSEVLSLYEVLRVDTTTNGKKEVMFT